MEIIPCNVLAVRFLANASESLCRGLGAPKEYPCLGFLTADSDDPLYIALDEATKAAQVQVCYAQSFYAGAPNATTPNAGEVLGVLAGPDPASVKSGLDAAVSALSRVGFRDVGVPCLAHTVSSCGTFLAKEAGVQPGEALAYLIAPPLESMYALDYALKAADVKLCKLYAPPTPTNFGGALLTGTRSACTAACEAFRTAVAEAAAKAVQNS